MLKQILNFIGMTMAGNEIDRLGLLAAGTLTAGYYHCYARKHNQHRSRKNARRTVFANRRIARGF
jgi:hypothetical protein